ncbi:unnamed protein product [Cuscuta europaea]|uniref:Uncharacterized protein n=1 Tax=Cuscuta europaea TaxID=41803 RepID=A0A9P0ZRJ6_CUSEU|nr:unnamed protein product [Cuscuta europaea]
MGDSSASSSYIHMVHQLIEHCLILEMKKEECMEVLAKRAGIQPIITSTGPPHKASSDKCTTRCSLGSKNDGGKIFSNLHRIMGISAFSFSMSETVIFFLVNSRKNKLISVIASQIEAVWNELEKENKAFFEAYSQSLTRKGPENTWETISDCCKDFAK